MVKYTVPAVLFLLSSAPAASAQINEDQASDLARKSVLAKLGETKESFLAVSSVPSLQQVLAHVLSEGHGPLPFVFHVSNEGEEHLGNVTKYHSHTDFILDVLVAVSASGQVYPIRWGSRALADFNRLANDYHVRIETEDQVRNYLAWFLAVNPVGDLTLEKMNSAQQLKETAEREFKGWGKSPEEEQAAFEAWWEKHQSQASRLDYETQVKRTNHGFSVSFYELSAIDRKDWHQGQSILQASIQFSVDGEAGRLAVKKARAD